MWANNDQYNPIPHAASKCFNDLMITYDLQCLFMFCILPSRLMIPTQSTKMLYCFTSISPFSPAMQATAWPLRRMNILSSFSPCSTIASSSSNSSSSNTSAKEQIWSWVKVAKMSQLFRNLQDSWSAKDRYYESHSVSIIMMGWVCLQRLQWHRLSSWRLGPITYAYAFANRQIWQVVVAMRFNFILFTPQCHHVRPLPTPAKTK